LNQFGIKMMHIRSIYLTLAIFLLGVSIGLAQEVESAADKKTDAAEELVKKRDESKPKQVASEPTKDKPEAAETKKPRPASTKSDDEFIKSLLPDLEIGDAGKAGSTEDELDRAIASMREAGRKINAGDVSKATQEIQKSVLSEIDKLIERLKNQSPPPRSKNQQNNKDRQSQSQKNRSTSPQQKQEQKQQAGTQGEAAGQQKSKAAESDEQNLRKAQEARNAKARRRALINEVWGHLPANVRERLLNVGGEKLLPKYDEMIRRYYESLAEGKSPKR
jgi:hypothetical protein